MGLDHRPVWGPARFESGSGEVVEAEQHLHLTLLSLNRGVEGLLSNISKGRPCDLGPPVEDQPTESFVKCFKKFGTVHGEGLSAQPAPAVSKGLHLGFSRGVCFSAKQTEKE